jgi:hypothetical protein
MRVLPATISAPTSGAIGKVNRARKFRRGDAANTDCHRTQAFGLTHCSQHIRRPPARRDTDQHVFGREAPAGQVANAEGGIVLRSFGGAAERQFAARHDALNHFGGALKVGGISEGVKDAEPPAGPGTQVKQPPAILERRDDRILPPAQSPESRSRPPLQPSDLPR